MSYFYGTSINDLENTDKRFRRKHSRRTVKFVESKLEPVHGLALSQSNRAVKAKHVNTVLAASGDANFNTEDDERTASLKRKNRRYLRKENEKLAEENRLLNIKLEKLNDCKESLGNIQDRDHLITKTRKKYNKLLKDHEELALNNEQMRLRLQQQDAEINNLRTHNEECNKAFNEVEKAKMYIYATNQKLQQENDQLNEDRILLKNVVYKLNVELERYQEKLKENSLNITARNITNIIDDIETDGENKKVLHSWGTVDTHALAPLLNAYQENILEKEHLISECKKELEEFTIRFKEIILENENLQKQIETLNSKYEKSVLEYETLTSDARLIKEQNDALLKQTSIQKQKLQEIHSVYEKKVESMSQDNNKLHKEYITCKSELSSLQGKYEILCEGYEKLKSTSDKIMPVSVHNAAVEEFKRLFEELKLQYESEKKKLNQRIKQLEDSQPDNDKELIMITAERDQMKITMKNLEKKFKHVQHKAQHLQNIVYSLQTSKDSFKRQLSKTTAYCEQLLMEYEEALAEKNKLSALLKTKEKESADIHYLGDSITHRMNSLKSQLKNVQKGAKQQLVTAKRQMKTQEHNVHQLKNEHCRELQRLKQLIKQKEQIIGKLRRENNDTQNNLEVVWKAATSDDKKVKNALKNTKICV
ncbi:centrosomal protein of 89 kDa-like [Prorops nasuta]|uniref:centrosomal protein of 89 kDa-like n=1 Tax=Prorops nasuta TaxID=863751 RepID=UPI0034CE6700